MNLENYELQLLKIDNSAHGDVAIFVRNNMKYKVIADLKRMSAELHCKVVALDIKTKPYKFVIVSLSILLYSVSSRTQYQDFENIPTTILHKITKEKKQLVIAGNFNINSLSDKLTVKSFKCIMRNYNCKSRKRSNKNYGK